MTKNRSRLWSAIASIAVMGLLTAACGSDDGGSEGASPSPSTGGGGGGTEELTTIRILTLPIVDDGPIFYGIDEGIFAEHGLNVEIATTAGGAAGIPAMLGGSADVVYGAILSGLQARNQDLPVQVVAAASTSLTAEESEADYVAIVTTPNTGVGGPADLADSTMAVNTLGNVNELFTKAFLDQEGVDPSAVELVELPFPDQPGALTSNRIQATMIGAPFLNSLLADEEGTVLGYPYRVQENPVVVGAYMTSEEFAADNAEALDAFVAALDEIIEEMGEPENRDRVISSLAANTRIDPALLEQIVLPNFTTVVNVDGLNETMDLAESFGLLEEATDLDEFLLDSAR